MGMDLIAKQIELSFSKLKLLMKYKHKHLMKER